MVEAGLAYRKGQLVSEAGYSQFENTGSRGYDFSRAYARFDWTVSAGVGMGLEVSHHTYTQRAFILAGFAAKRYLVLLRYQK